MAKRKIMYLNPVGLDTFDQLFADMASEIKLPDTEVHVTSLAPDYGKFWHIEYRAYEAVVTRGIVRAARQAAQEGFDAPEQLLRLQDWIEPERIQFGSQPGQLPLGQLTGCCHPAQTQLRRPARCVHGLPHLAIPDRTQCRQVGVNAGIGSQSLHLLPQPLRQHQVKTTGDSLMQD